LDGFLAAGLPLAAVFAFAGAFAGAFALALAGFAGAFAGFTGAFGLARAFTGAFAGAFTGIFVLAGAFAADFAGFTGAFVAFAIRVSSLSNMRFRITGPRPDRALLRTKSFASPRWSPVHERSVKGLVLHPDDARFPEFFSLQIRFHGLFSLISSPVAGDGKIPG
jgi:hypothetical protein